MTLKEALESGKKFRRNGDKVFSPVEFYETDVRTIFTVQDALATDWEIEEDTVTITKEMLINALSEARRHYYPPSWPQYPYEVRQNYQTIPQNPLQQNYQGIPHQCPKYYIDANFVWDKLKEAQLK